MISSRRSFFARAALVGLASLGVLAGCASTPPKAFSPEQARVRGHTSSLMDQVAVELARADQPEPRKWESSVVVPPGPCRLAVRWQSHGTPGLLVLAMQNDIANSHAKQIAFNARAGHDYFVEKLGVTVFTNDFRVTDTTTGEVVASSEVGQR